jgi:hypothetical protein
VSKEALVGQGTAMGLSDTFMSLGRIIGPIWEGYIFDINIHYPYLSGSLFMFIGFLVRFVFNPCYPGACLLAKLAQTLNQKKTVWATQLERELS